MTAELSETLALAVLRLSRQSADADAVSLASQMIYRMSKRGGKRDPDALLVRLRKWQTLIGEDKEGTRRRFAYLIESLAAEWSIRS